MQLLTESAKQRIANFIVTRIPMLRRTVFKPLLADQSIATANIDAATIHAILDGTDTGQTNEYFALCDLMLLSDSHMQGEIAKRKLALLGDQLTIAPAKKKDAVDTRAADLCREQVDGLPSFLESCAALLDGSLWPLAIAEKIFRPATRNRKLSYEIDNLIRVPPRLFDFSTGFLRIWDTDRTTGNVLSTTSEPDPMRYVIHRGHLLSTPDYRGGPMRSLVFWWSFSAFGRDWWARFMDRYGAPFMVGKYDQADDESRIILENAFSLASKISGLVISRQTEVEIHEAQSKSGGEGYDLFLKTSNREKSKLIVGQTTSSDAETGGLSGSGVSKVQQNVRSDIRQWDGVSLGNTLKHQLFVPFLRFNGIPGDIKISWGGDEAESIEQVSSAVASLSGAGLEVTDDGLEALSGLIGLPLQRKKIEEPPPGAPPTRGKVLPLSVDLPDRYRLAETANIVIAREGAADLARAFSGAFAPIARFVADSSGPDDLIAKITAHYSGPSWPPERVAPLILEALAAMAANGAARNAA
jgi:phage gp29-like protein